MSGPADAWASFPHDPRNEANAPLRAADSDRDIVQQLLAEAFADGRLDREEYDGRSDQVLAARTLGELPPLVRDLVPDRPGLATSSSNLVQASPADLQQRAEVAYRSQRMNALFTFLGPTVIVWVIYLFSSMNGGSHFPWPVFVMLGTGINFARVLTSRQEYVDKEVRRLEKKQAKALKWKSPE